MTDRTFRTKSFRVGKLVELGNEKDPDSIYGIVTEVKDKHIAIEVNRLSILILEEIVRRVARRTHGMYYLRQRSHVDLELSVKSFCTIFEFICYNQSSFRQSAI